MTSPAGPTGLLVLDKPAGWTSHDVVARTRRLASTRKVGHAGTLDPMATGVLLLGLGRATRLLGHLQLADKEYLATVRLGQSTVTDDAEGEVTGTADASGLDEDRIRHALEGLTGEIDQVPSAVSAIKVDGRRSYARVRAGEDVDLAARRVTVSTLDLVEVRREGPHIDLDVRVVCSSGTYVRALARDMGDSTGVGGHLTSLRRTRVAGFDLSEARTLDDLEREFTVMDIAAAARRAFPIVQVSEQDAVSVRFGRSLPDLELPADGPVALFDPDGTFLALHTRRDGASRPLAVFV